MLLVLFTWVISRPIKFVVNDLSVYMYYQVIELPMQGGRYTYPYCAVLDCSKIK